MAFFSDATPLLRRLQRFAREVEKDVRSFNATTLEAFRVEFESLGERELNALFDALEKQHFPKGDTPELLQALRPRHVLRWQLNIRNAFAVARDSVPENANPVRAKDELGNRRSIQARLDRATGRSDGGERPTQNGGRELFAILRAGAKKGPRRRQVRLRLVPYLKQLVQVSPRNAQRDFVSLKQRVASPRGEPALYRISVGVGPNSCKTCKALNGRVLTRGAIQIATTSVKPVLFHPNCRHRVESQGLQGLRMEDYDPSKLGPLVTVTVLRAMIARGVLEGQAPKRAFVSV